MTLRHTDTPRALIAAIRTLPNMAGPYRQPERPYNGGPYRQPERPYNGGPRALGIPRPSPYPYHTQAAEHLAPSTTPQTLDIPSQV